MEEKLHITNTNADSAYATADGAVIRATKSGDYYAVTNDGSIVEYSLEVPAAYDITGWNIEGESWTAGTNKIYSEETLFDVHTVNTKVETVKTPFSVQLDTLTTWNNIPEIGRNVSGTAHYEASFNWDTSKADGAYLNFGDGFVSSMKVWINGVKVGGDASTNPTKIPASIVDGYEGKELSAGGVNWVKQKFSKVKTTF